jgi:hypothetical protein
VAGCYRHNNGPLHSVKCEEFPAKLKNYELGKKDNPLGR